MNNCPQCNGLGKIKITVAPFFGKKEWDSFDMNCFTCDVNKTATKTQVDQFNFEKNMWCKCSNAGKFSQDTYFVDDNKRKDLKKHHYRCSICDKVTQIG
jgi:hypothetical protein